MSYEDMSKTPAEVLDAGATIVDAAVQLTREGRPRGKMVMEAIGVYDSYRQQLTRERDAAQAEVERLRQLLWRRCGQCGMEGCLIVGDAIDNMPAGQARKFEEAKRGRA